MPRALLMALCPDETGEFESEPVLLEYDARTVTLTTDDGMELIFDLAELRQALDSAAHDVRRRRLEQDAEGRGMAA